jgi:malate dehydrogenase (oxaloacetate-decarboxylating)
LIKSNLKEEAIKLHKEHLGKIEIVSKIDVTTEEQLSLVYTPGVADVCKAIVENPEQVDVLTSRGHMVAIVTDGTAVLGLGDIDQKQPSLLWKGKLFFLKSLLMWMPFHFA